MSDSSTIELPPAAPPPPHRPGPRRRRIIVTAALGALVLAVPPTLYFSLRNGSGGTAAATASPGVTGSVSAPAPSVGLSGKPSSGPSATPGRTTEPAAPAAADGRISAAVLENATLNIPAWPADNLAGLSGPVKFTNGTLVIPASAAFSTARHMGIDRIVYGDVDRDGAQETVAAIHVRVEGGSVQLVAFDRDRAGRIVTLGTVAATTGPVRVIDQTAFRIQPNGVVDARVGDYEGCCGDQTPVQWQWRSYGWNGQRFHQVGGPTAFPVNASVTETGMTAGELVLGPAIGGMRHGMLTVTVYYLYGAVPDHLTIEFFLSAPNDVKPDLTAWPPTYVGKIGGLAVDVPTPAPGVRKSYTFAFSRPAGDPDTTFWLQVYGNNAKNKMLSESSMYNATATVRVHSAG